MYLGTAEVKHLYIGAQSLTAYLGLHQVTGSGPVPQGEVSFTTTGQPGEFYSVGAGGTYRIGDGESISFTNYEHVSFTAPEDVVVNVYTTANIFGFNRTMPVLKSCHVNAVHMTELYNSTSNYGGSFQGQANLVEFKMKNSSNVRIMQYTWKDCTALTYFPDDVEYSSTEDLSSTWSGCSSLRHFPAISTPAATGMHSIWSSCPSLQTLGGADFSKATTINYLLVNNSKLTCVGGTIDTTAATTKLGAFDGCTALLQPDSAAQADLTDANGALWVNGGACNPNNISIRSVHTNLEDNARGLTVANDQVIISGYASGFNHMTVPSFTVLGLKLGFMTRDSAVPVSTNLNSVVASTDRAILFLDLDTLTVKSKSSIVTSSDSAHGFVVVGDYAYGAYGNSTVFSVIDISDSDNPGEIGMLNDTVNMGTFRSLAVQGNYAMTASVSSNVYELSVIDISNKAAPVFAAGYGVQYISEVVKVSDTKVAVTTSTTKTLILLDTTDPLNISELSTLVTSNYLYNIAVWGNYLCGYVYGSPTIVIVDISNPASMAIIETIDLSDFGTSSVGEVYIDAKYIVVAMSSNTDDQASSIVITHTLGA